MNDDWLINLGLSGMVRRGSSLFDTPETKKTYKEASGIDIDEQHEIWNERAKGYWGEYKVFTLLYRELDFPNKMLLNLQIPSDNGRTTEIDLLLISPTGIYVFEIKHYSGKVYGGYDKPTWTEYYKSRDSVTFDNPLLQNEYHLKQLRHLLPDETFFSYVVFTNSSAEIKVGGRYPGSLTVSHLEDLVEKIRGDFAGREEIYSPAKIESIFKTLEKYSPMETNQKEFLAKESAVLPFSSFAAAILQDVEREKQKVRDSVAEEVSRQTKELRQEREEILKLKNEYRGLISAAEAERDGAKKALEEFEKNFEMVTPFTSEYGIINRDCFKTEVRFEESGSFLRTVNMYFTLKNTSKELWIETRNAWFIVGLKNGSAQKYVLEKHLIDNFNGSKIGPGAVRYGSPRMIRVFNAPLEDIRFIKLCNAIVSDQQLGNRNVAPGVEFEIYVAEGEESVYSIANPTEVSPTANGKFELNPDFMKSDVTIVPSSDGQGSDVRFCFEAGTEEIGFELYTAHLILGCCDGTIKNYRILDHVKNFYNHTIMPKSKTNLLTMHLPGINADDIVFVKLKDMRVFRKERWQNDNILPGVEFDLYRKES